MKYVDEKYNFLKPIINQNLIRIGEKFDGGYNDWQTRQITVDIDDRLAISGSSYLAVYSEIYERNQHRT